MFAAILDRDGQLRPSVASVHRWCTTQELWSTAEDVSSDRALPDDVESELRGLSARTSNPAGRDWDKVLEKRRDKYPKVVPVRVSLRAAANAARLPAGDP